MMRSIVESSLRFRPLVIAIAVIAMAIGIAQLDDMPVDIFPEILPVTVHVQTEALGLSAAEIEQLITVPIEADLLAGTPWVDVMRSESVPGLSSIELQFKPGTDPMDARQVVQERLTQAHALPNVSKPPHMLEPASSTNRIMMIGLSSKDQSLIQMSVLARWTIRPRLMGVPGVANVAIWGQRERQLQVLVDPEVLRDNKIPLIDIVKTAGNALWYSPLSFLESHVAGAGGFIETPNQRIGVRHVLPIQLAKDLAQLPVEGSPKRLDEVATVVEDHQPLIGDAMNDKGAGLMLVVEKLPGVNTLEVTGEILEALESLKPGLGGIEFDPQVYQPANYIRTAIGNVSLALLIGLALATVALLALTASWRAALIALVAIPVSLMTAVLVMVAAGATVNAMVLAGLVIALAVVIDDGILDADNFLRRLRRGGGKSTLRTLVEASAEMRSPLLFATAIMLLIAVPILFMTGAAGAFAKPMALTYMMAVLASLVVATTLTPALGLVLLQKTPLARRESPFTTWLNARFDRMPARAIASPRAGFALALVALVVGVMLVPKLRVTTAPTFKEPDLLVQWDAMPGTSGPAMNRIVDRVSRELKGIPGVRDVGAHVGRAILADQVVGMNSSELWVSLDPKADYDATVAAVGEVVSGYPGIDGDVMTYLRSRFDDALSGVDEPIVVRVYGQELRQLGQQAEKVRQSLAGISGIVDPRVELEPEEPVVEIKVDLDKARMYGIKPGDVRRPAATLLAGILVGNLFEEQKVFEVVVWGSPKVRHSVEAIQALLIDTPDGGHVRLGEVASVQIAPAPDLIRRENVARCIDVVASVSGRDLDAVAADVRAQISSTQFPLEYHAELMGGFAAQQAARWRVIWMAVGAVVGILLILQAAFGSWRLAIAVLATLPIAVAGGVIAAVASGTVLSLGSLAGLLAVLGLSARHSILLVNRYRDLRHSDGHDFGPEVVLHGTRERATPILTATIVTALAMVPFALFGTRPGQEILGPMAVVILGGLITATLYTLCVVPVLYARFGAGAMPDALDEENLDVAV